MDKDWLVGISMADLIAREEARIDALEPRQATETLIKALERLAQQEAARLGVACIDWTYHGCDPVWQAALKAASDVAAVVLDVQHWGVAGVRHIELNQGAGEVAFTLEQNRLP